MSLGKKDIGFEKDCLVVSEEELNAKRGVAKGRRDKIVGVR